MFHPQLLQESVALTLVNGIDRIDRKAIISSISKIVPVEDVESFGNLGDHRKWFITFKSTATKEKFLEQSTLKVNDQSFSIDKPYRNVKQIRLPNVPPYIPDGQVLEIVSKWNGSVISIECESLPRPYNSIKSFVRRIKMKFPSFDAEQTVPLSCRIAGTKCQVCNEIGHDDPLCIRRKSFASVVNSVPLNIFSSSTPTPKSNNGVVNGKTCHTCKQPGHVKKNCPTASIGNVYVSTPIPNEVTPASVSTPSITATPVNTNEMESPQLVVTTETRKPGAPFRIGSHTAKTRKEFCTTPEMVRRDRQCIPPTSVETTRPEEKSNEIEAYKEFKEGRGARKRSLQDDYQSGSNESKKQHQISSHVHHNMGEDGGEH